MKVLDGRADPGRNLHPDQGGRRHREQEQPDQRPDPPPATKVTHQQPDAWARKSANGTFSVFMLSLSVIVST